MLAKLLNWILTANAPVQAHVPEDASWTCSKLDSSRTRAVAAAEGVPARPETSRCAG